MKPRFIALTDINRGIEVDDIQSMVRLLLYSNLIDIEGLIPCTSCFVRKGARRKQLSIILDIIDAYEKVRPNLERHETGFPNADYLRGVTCHGIPEFGQREGKGFADDAYNDNPGVNRIIAAADRDDDRPLWIGLWGGANTLAQAVWKVCKLRSNTEFDRFLAKLRIYGISDQDQASRWMRENFGGRLFYIVSPSSGDFKGTRDYYRATWPGISADRNKHGSNDGKSGGGFAGARTDMVSRAWLKRHIISHGEYGALYPQTSFIMEGDTPTYVGLIPNGLNEPEHPDYGGWGGRYKLYLPDRSQVRQPVKYPIWTGSSDTVMGVDSRRHTSPQATIWRWREAFQNDFAARMDWTMTDDYKKANHPPVVRLAHANRLTVRGGDYVTLDASPSFDPDGDALSFHWFCYNEAGDYEGGILIDNSTVASAGFLAPAVTAGRNAVKLHIILEVRDNGTPALSRYQRVIVSVTHEAPEANDR